MTNARVQMIPIDRIVLLNARVRNRRKFIEVLDSIENVGLKRPIKVNTMVGPDGQRSYGLACGQGRIEAFRELGQTEIPALVTDASEEDCMVMSLVENCARRQHPSLDLLQDVTALRQRGYTDREIAQKIGMSSEWVSMMAQLIERGEQRLVRAVEAGTIPISVAIEIARSDSQNVQQLLADAYTQGKLTGSKLIKVRRLIEARSRRGKRVHESALGKKLKKASTSDALVRIFQQEADRQRLLVKKAEVTQTRLLFVVEALKNLLADENFVTLLRAEKLDTLPKDLDKRIMGAAI
ncbi:plasmid partitioning protein RepB C-terminal domain-containing protein [Chelatococcus reniformis]|uniref:Chromosome partitioning protein ParB n=1 Tax=Chelatococcus reniformis TaxID=1494448 RepID=A0A916XS33_9HYPH|nr:plasmid partitioning protein RepB C-terminal domain-containing protein [Chelatococcus reniformis]GGC95023.1 chromosome partitioning protein ParB [Chelatococcus reniformis]